MLQIESKKTIESTTTPGVTFVVRRLNRIQRAKRDLGALDAHTRLAEAIDRYRELDALATRTPRQEVERRACDYEAGLIINQHLKPASVSAALVSIAGLEIDGVAVDAVSLIETGGPETDALMDEIYAACEAASSLSVQETKNSQSPSTLPVATDGEAKATTAGTVA